VDVEGLGEAEPVLVPDLGHEVLAPDGTPGSADEQVQHVVLLARERELLAVEVHDAVSIWLDGRA
jgi:hypothetical protein